MSTQLVYGVILFTHIKVKLTKVLLNQFTVRISQKTQRTRKRRKILRNCMLKLCENRCTF